MSPTAIGSPSETCSSRISNLPDANDLPGYDDLLASHQTPESLVQFIRGRAPLGEPGGKSQREEHSAFNLLTLIIEKTTGLPFKDAAKREVFAPLGMRNSGIDDDSPIPPPVASGYAEKGAVALTDAETFHWSAKTGNGSAYSTIDDERRWITGFLSNAFLSDAARQTMLNWGDGYGWTAILADFPCRRALLRDERSGSWVFVCSHLYPDAPHRDRNSQQYNGRGANADGLRHRGDCRWRRSITTSSCDRPLCGPTKIAKIVGRYKFGPTSFRPKRNASRWRVAQTD